jgi:triacylglycerol lipase
MSFLTKLPLALYDRGAFDGFAATGDFTLGTAKAMAWLSQLSYETDEPDKIAGILQGWGLRLGDPGIIVEEVGTVLPKASTHCILATGRGANFIAFAGTDPLVLANWISDFDAHIDETKTAEGFQIAADAVWPRLKAAMAKTPLADNKMFVTGHSLGGALAALTALRIDRDRVGEICAVYTFGMPRPGSADFADGQYNPRLGARTYRLVHGDDLVPTVAPSDLHFHHLGRYLRCERGGKFSAADLAADPTSDDPLFVDGVAKKLNGLLHSPLSSILSPLARLKLALALVTGRGPPGMRTDSGGILIELLPPRLRDHMPDRYIGAF